MAEPNWQYSAGLKTKYYRDDDGLIHYEDGSSGGKSDTWQDAAGRTVYAANSAGPASTAGGAYKMPAMGSPQDAGGLAAGIGQIQGPGATGAAGTTASFGGAATGSSAVAEGQNLGNFTASPTPVGGAAPGVSPGIVNGVAQWNVTTPQTVAGQVNSLTDPNSPLIQQARAQALQGMNARGIVNSSLAQTAADAAAYQTALPIATADAATYSKAAGYNVDQANQATALGKQLDSQWRQAQLSADTTRYGTDVNAASNRYNTDVTAGTNRYNTDSGAATTRYTAELQADTQRLNNESQQTIARLNNDQQITVAKLNADNNKLLNTNRDAATAFNNSMQYINSINQNDKMDSETKTRAIAQIYYNLDTQLRTLTRTSGLEVSKTLSLANSPGFDAEGRYVGFGEGTGGASAVKPAPTTEGRNDGRFEQTG